jgi:hypothetical protein
MKITEKKRLKIDKKARALLSNFHVQHGCYIGVLTWSVGTRLYLIREDRNREYKSLQINIRQPYKNLKSHLIELFERALIDKKLDM